MDILGIGPLEAFFIILIMLIVLGPRDMVKAGRTLGKFIRKIVTSPTWQLVRNTSRTLQNLPTTLAREAGMEELQRDLLKSTQEISQEINQELLQSAWTGAQNAGGKRTIAPPPVPRSDPLAAWTTPPPPDNAAAPSIPEPPAPASPPPTPNTEQANEPESPPSPPSE